MAQYKVLQDIEAEDKLLGPLSLRQFIYAAIVIVLGFVAFKLLVFKWFLAIPFLPPMIFFGLLAAPFGRDQPSEVWLLAKIRFFLKARKRIWDQAGVKELVTITVPKKIERIVSKGFSEQEVTSRLKALASTLDTRGWAVKNIDTATFQQPLVITGTTTDRLVDISSIPKDVPTVTVDPESDILDETNNPVAQQVEQSLTESTQAHRQELLNKVRAIADAQNTQNQKPPASSSSTTTKSDSGLSAQDQAVLDHIRATANQTSSVQSNNSLSTTTSAQSVQIQHQAPHNQSQTAVTPPSDPGILKLVKNNDLNVATIGREASRKKDEEPPTDEVVISLR
jgi:hypothetical protein